MNPWWQTFRAGTRISSALDLARGMLVRDRVRNGYVVLVSDLETAPDDVESLTRTVRRFQQDRIDMRIVPLSASSDGLALFEGLLGKKVFAALPAENGQAERVLSVGATSPVPTALLLLGGLLFAVLALHSGTQAGSHSPVHGVPGRRRHEAAHCIRRRRRRLSRRCRGLLRAGNRCRALAKRAPGGRRPVPDVPRGRGPRQPAQTLPKGAAGAILGVRDDVRFREALRMFRLSRLDEGATSDPRLALARSDARARLQEIAGGNSDRRLRSRAMGLLGVLSFVGALSDARDQAVHLQDAVATYQSAIDLDPTNDEAKANLELALQRGRGVQPSESGGGANPSPGGSGAKGAGAGEPGSGY